MSARADRRAPPALAGITACVAGASYGVGRAVAALLADQQLKARSGTRLDVGHVALQYGFTDIDGRVPDYSGSELAPNMDL